ncbi:hypothetical protein BJX99DRAFT_33097 [Aspergillus californicus]
MSSPNKHPRVKKTASHHQCPHCDRAYERPDHLARHVDSHRNQRTFQCPTCHRGFNRRDVLQRHRLVHTEGKSISHCRERVIAACEECASAKLSCDNSRPCKRCNRKGVSCLPRKFRRHRESTTSTPKTEESRNQFDATMDATPSSGPIETPFFEGNGPFYSPTTSTPIISLAGSEGDNLLHNAARPYDVAGDFPAFFEHIMSSDMCPDSMFGLQQPRGVFDFMGEPEFTNPETGLFEADKLVDLDMILEFNPSPNANPGVNLVAEDQSTKQRVDAFRKSLWLWIPEKNQNGFSEEGQLPLRDGDMTASIFSLHKSRLDGLNIRGKLTPQLRDSIFQLVIATAGSQLSVPTFPTAESLDALIKIGISKRTETDAWIHPYTLYRRDSRPELLTALVAAGCVCCGIPSINKTGVLLLEIVRVSLTQLVESDNSVLRDLQFFQASMMWLDIGIFCGYKRKMQIAESHLQPLCTALRRGGAFDRSFYSQIQPLDDFHDQGLLERTWHAWIQQESLKRLAYHLFEHDVEAAAAMNRPSLTSYTEFTLPFPSSRELWLAPTAGEWKRLWEAEYCAMSSDLSLRELLADPTLIKNLPVNVDRGVVRSALLHGLMSQVWNLRQQALLTDSCPSATRPVTRLWLQSRQEDLLSLISNTKSEMSDAPAIATLLSEYAMMHLHMSFDSIQRFAGMFGEHEARREYLKVRDWSLTREARLAIWHAGQALRAARQVPPFQLRGFDGLAIYHAVLILWVFGLLRCGEKHRGSFSNDPNTDPGTRVVLDGEANGTTQAFIDQDIGQPGLMLHPAGSKKRLSPVFCQLRSPRSVMDVGKQVFESNFPGATDSLPPLIENLRNLIRDLGILP